MSEYEYMKESHPGWGAVILAIFMLLILGSGLLLHRSIPEVEAEWDFGALPDTPGQSIYSMRPPPALPAPRQVAMLPDAVTGKVDQVEGVLSNRQELTP